MLLSHLYKNTALFAVAVFIVMGVGLTSHPNESIQTQASASEVTLTMTMGKKMMWTSANATSYSFTSGRAYTFSSGNLSWPNNSANATFPSGTTTTANGWIANTGATTYGRINSIVLSLSASTNLDAWVSTTTPITDVANPTTIANTVKLTTTASTSFTITPTVGLNYKYFFFRSPTLGAAVNVTQIVVKFMPILSSIGITTAATTTSFEFGQPFNSNGLGITGTYDNTSTAVETGFITSYDGHTFIASDGAGAKTVLVTYLEFGVSVTTNYTITVSHPALQSIRTSYTSGVGVDQFAINDVFASVPVYAVWSSGSDSLLTSSVTFSIGGTTYVSGTSALSTAGSFEVTASYLDPVSGIPFTAAYTIWVFALSSIAITAYPTKSVSGGTNFGLNETFTSAGLAITGTYVYSGKTNINRVKSSGFSLSTPDMSAIGSRQITVSLVAGGVTKTATYQIRISNAVSSAATDSQFANSMADYVLSINACGCTNAMVLEMTNEYSYMTRGAKELFNVKTNRIGNDWSTGTGAKDRYDYLLYLHPNYFQGAANDGSAEALIENSVLPGVLILSAIALMVMSAKFIHSRKRKEN